MHTNGIISILGLAASVSAHITMVEPVGWSVDSSPLEKDGSNFPCKAVTYDDSVTRTKMSKGDKQPVQFKGSAVHGGGSCQISLTTDLKPTKDSVWKVIKSYEGGCPAADQAANYAEDPNLALGGDYNFEIPDDVPAGQYTLAWTWFNKIGNREMYMNCAPIEADGSGGDEASFSALPDMLVANIGTDCTTKEGDDIQFPNPGKAVERLGNPHFGDPLGEGCAAGSGSGSGSGSGDSYGGGESASPAESSAPAESAAPSNPGGIFAPVESAAPEPTEAPSAPATSAPAEAAPTSAAETAPTSVAEAPAEPTTGGGSYEEGGDESALPSQEVPAQGNEEAGSGSGSGSGGHEVGTACTTDGFWNCVGGNSFQRCGSGIWSAVQQLSEGTECTPGESETIQMVRKRGSTRFGAKFLL